MKKIFEVVLGFLAAFGLVDASYLTYEHYQQVVPPCTVNRLLPIASDCGKVLRSSYSVMFGVPLAVIGIFQYTILLLAIFAFIFWRKNILAFFLIIQTMVGAAFSFYFMYIQIGILKSICIYCTWSAIISLTIFFIVYKLFSKERFSLRLSVLAFLYQKLLKPVLFLTDPEVIHDGMVNLGNIIGSTFIKKYFDWKLNYKSTELKQNLVGVKFSNPVGLAAGFDYDAKLTRVLYTLGFGFQTVGTISNQSYRGNPKPRLGRLPKSRSLMVNKGFKNIGANRIADKLKGLDFNIPLGISIGVSNNENLEKINQAISDILGSFIVLEKNKINNSFYELNISCPNLINNKLDFYKPALLNKLLTGLKNLNLKKPVFIKMPIDKSNQQFLAILKVAINYDYIRGIIIGNLLKDRKSPLIEKSEAKKFKVGNFSGKPCEPRSNELIKLAYKKYKGRFIIVGCGGVFSGYDAYRKIKLGANLIQLITGMIYQGPQLISQINLELVDLIEKDGYKNIAEAVGKNNLI